MGVVGEDGTLGRTPDGAASSGSLFGGAASLFGGEVVLFGGEAALFGGEEPDSLDQTLFIRFIGWCLA